MIKTLEFWGRWVLQYWASCQEKIEVRQKVKLEEGLNGLLIMKKIKTALKNVSVQTGINTETERENSISRVRDIRKRFVELRHGEKSIQKKWRLNVPLIMQLNMEDCFVPTTVHVVDWFANQKRIIIKDMRENLDWMFCGYVAYVM